jgi:hypothetical protein
MSHAIVLHRRTPSSYGCNNVAALAAYLRQQGYGAVPTRTTTEYARMQRDTSLIVVFHSGTVLLQGRDTSSAHRLLAPFVREEPKQGGQP